MTPNQNNPRPGAKGEPPADAPRPNGDLDPREYRDNIDQAEDDSFPASDPPSQTPTTGSGIDPKDEPLPRKS